MRIALLLSCVLCGTACGGPESRPAQDPASASSPSNTTVTGAAATSSAADPTPVYESPSVASAARPTPSPVRTSSDTSAPLIAPTTTPGDSRATDPAPRADANVVSNPGVADQTKNADNTKINDRDRHGAPTPMNQGNSRDEIKITAAIRRELMSDKALSFTAKNVKIITVGTKVTLRGPVNSDQEKAAIEAHAKQASGVTDVDDQLEVKK